MMSVGVVRGANSKCEAASTTSHFAQRLRSNGSALAELETLARFLLSVLLPLDHTRVARHVTIAAQRRLQRLIELDESARDGVANGAGLSGAASPIHIGRDVE